jgi:tetratricopeptide (TPR) repeat protein
VAHTVRHLGDILRKQGQGVSSESCYSEALEIYRKSQETPLLDLANTLRGFALLKGENGEAEEARSLWREARDLYAALNIQAGVDEGNRRISLLSQA